MFTVKISPFIPIDGLEHIATSYQVSNDTLGTIILDEMLESNVFLNLYTSPIDAPINSTYYVRFKRHFKFVDAITKETKYSDGAWSEYKPLETVEFEGGLVLISEIKIDVPVIKIDKDKFIKDDIVTISTSKFRGVNDGHFSTSWIITDLDLNVLYFNPNDQVNLNSITIDKRDYGINSKTMINIFAIHKGSSGIESPAGDLKVTLEDFNFEIVSSLSRVMPFTNYNVKIKIIDFTIPTKIVKIELLRVDSDEPLYQKDITSETSVTSFTLPGELLEPDANYFLDIYSYSNGNTVKTKRKPLYTLPDTNSRLIDTNYVYSKELKSVYSIDDTFNYPSYMSTKETFYGMIPIALKNNRNLYKAKFNRETNKLEVSILDKIKGVSLLSDNSEDIYLRITYDSILLIDTYTVVNGKEVPIFLVYRYNRYTDMCDLLFSKIREDETRCIGYANNVIYKDNDKMLYIPYGSNKIKLFNYIFNTLEDYATLPFNYDKSVSLFEIQSNRYMVIGGNEKYGYIFNTDNMTFSEGFSVPLGFRGRELKTVFLINGDVLIYRLDKKLEDTENNVLYYSYDTNKLEPTKPAYVSNVYQDTNILMSTGELLLINNGDTMTSHYLLS